MAFPIEYVAGAIATIAGSYFSYRTAVAKVRSENEEKIVTAQQVFSEQFAKENEHFRQEVMGYLQTSREREVELENKVRDLENRLSVLIKQNEELMVEKLDWMSRYSAVKKELDEV